MGLMTPSPINFQNLSASLSASQFSCPHKSKSAYGIFSLWWALTHLNLWWKEDAFKQSTITVTISILLLYQWWWECCPEFGSLMRWQHGGPHISHIYLSIQSCNILWSKKEFVWSCYTKQFCLGRAEYIWNAINWIHSMHQNIVVPISNQPKDAISILRHRDPLVPHFSILLFSKQYFSICSPPSTNSICISSYWIWSGRFLCNQQTQCPQIQKAGLIPPVHGNWW